MLYICSCHGWGFPLAGLSLEQGLLFYELVLAGLDEGAAGWVLWCGALELSSQSRGWSAWSSSKLYSKLQFQSSDKFLMRWNSIYRENLIGFSFYETECLLKHIVVTSSSGVEVSITESQELRISGITAFLLHQYFVSHFLLRPQKGCKYPVPHTCTWYPIFCKKILRPLLLAFSLRKNSRRQNRKINIVKWYILIYTNL